MKCGLFPVNSCQIPFAVYEDGTVNVGCTGLLDVKDFAELAHAVLKASNEETGGFVGLPNDSRNVDF